MSPFEYILINNINKAIDTIKTLPPHLSLIINENQGKYKISIKYTISESLVAITGISENKE